MELSGEEKKLQALFSELKAADKQATPHFGATWNRARIAPRRIRMFKPAFITAVLLVFGTVAFVVWSRYARTTPPPTVIAKAPPIRSTTPATEGPSAATTETPTPKPKNAVMVLHRNKTTNQRNAVVAANRKLEKDAKSIANWTSPTSALLESPSDEMFSSLPEFNQSATQLKSFLPSRPN